MKSGDSFSDTSIPIEQFRWKVQELLTNLIEEAHAQQIDGIVVFTVKHSHPRNSDCKMRSVLDYSDIVLSCEFMIDWIDHLAARFEKSDVETSRDVRGSTPTDGDIPPG